MKRIKAGAGSLSLFLSLFIFRFVQVARTQPQTNATTDPSEVRALNAMLEKWGLSASNQWNISGEPCSGAAIDSTDIHSSSFNPGIKCDCTYNSHSTCHITQLKVYSLDVVGAIPDELWNLTFLINLTFGINALSGELPKELGKLTDLRSLAFSTNYFSGSLPSELGNLTRLEQLLEELEKTRSQVQPMCIKEIETKKAVTSALLLPQALPRNKNHMSNVGKKKKGGNMSEVLDSAADKENLNFYHSIGRDFSLRTIEVSALYLWRDLGYFDSSGVSGGIPLSFASLQSLTIVRLQGNSFEGSVPSTFSNLTSMTDLRISDLPDGSSSLDFFTDMKSLNILILRNNNISGSIPSSIAEFQSLSQLKEYIPPKYVSTAFIVVRDLSYNELSGSFPSWINQQNLQMINLVANNFTIESSISSVMPSGLNCLQRNFPCHRATPIYYSFAIKCGGPQITSSDRIVYERDNETLGPATYYVTNTDRWAVSNVGWFADSNNPQYTTSSLSQFTNTLDSEIFQTARISAASLRYYGLGLENGNYNVVLQFAETVILNPPTWKSVGRRVFDIYIQGNLVRKDFDIRKEAGNASFRAVQRNFTVQVSENYLEIHLFWAGKGTCCVPGQGTYGPSISAISAIADFNPTVSNNPPSGKKKRTGLVVGTILAVGVVSFFCVFAVYYFVLRRRKSSTYEDEEFLGMDARIYTFSYAELRAATDDFDPANKLGEGGFGAVYKATLDDGRVVAVKQLSVASNQGKSQFVAEIATISAVQHRNLVKLHGCCIEGEKRLLVYEYLENKSLDQALFGNRCLELDWTTRFDICLGVARGLAYLHEESRLRIVHRDVKASNILLDFNLDPKISDFGLAKLYDDNKTHLSTRVAGTIGYLAPEYAMRGHLTEKVDVFGFGVVALEIISGRPNSDPSLEEEKIYLLEWAWHLHENNHEIELVDPAISEFNKDEAKRVIGVALLCTQTSPALRPSMSRAVAMLSGDIDVSTVTSRPGYLTEWRFNDATSFMSNDASAAPNNSFYNSSASTSMVADPTYSPVDAQRPMLHEVIGEGR
ncbi:unnamed protein product [Ilex paraguariensis]|uniref:non-specific serine/threonine protein kinase n=1 Tax=Ilex paraguariensis TaxID=185542 RepID=A0ABC8T8D7_9AQUA